MEEEIQPISLGACIKPFPCVVLVYAESRQDLQSKIRKRIIPLAKGPLTKNNSQMTAVDITSTAEQLLQRHVHHLSPVPREQLHKVLGVVGLLIRGADVNTAVIQTEVTLSLGKSVKENQVSPSKSNLVKKSATGEEGVKPKKRVSFKENPHVQHFTRNSSSNDSSEEEAVQVAKYNPPTNQAIHLPSIQLPGTGQRVQLKLERRDSSSESEDEEVEENDEYEEDDLENEPDEQSVEESNEPDKPQLEDEKREDDEEVVTEEIATEEVISEEETSQKLVQSDQSDRSEKEVKNKQGSQNNGAALNGPKSGRNHQNKGGVIEASFSWNLDSEDEEFVF